MLSRTDGGGWHWGSPRVMVFGGDYRATDADAESLDLSRVSLTGVGRIQTQDAVPANHA